MSQLLSSGPPATPIRLPASSFMLPISLWAPTTRRSQGVRIGSKHEVGADAALAHHPDPVRDDEIDLASLQGDGGGVVEASDSTSTFTSSASSRRCALSVSSCQLTVPNLSTPTVSRSRAEAPRGDAARTIARAINPNRTRKAINPHVGFSAIGYKLVFTGHARGGQHGWESSCMSDTPRVPAVERARHE